MQVEATGGRVVVWRGGVARVRTPAGLEPRCPVDFQVFADGYLSGSVVDGRGRPQSGIVTAQCIGRDDSQGPRLGGTAMEGRFEVSRL